uniref:DUF1618 domain-containing protein n=1 Tax=Leersia perrieri TaxID=77586 RepID=A0A0D9XG07_9ORYZ
MAAGTGHHYSCLTPHSLVDGKDVLPSVVLERRVLAVHELGDWKMRQTEILRCDRITKYGLPDELMEWVVRIGAQVVAPPAHSTMFIIMSRVEQEAMGGLVRAELLATNEHIIVMSVSFPMCRSSSRFYLVYDASDASICMAPDLQSAYPNRKVIPAVTIRPLPVRRDVRHYSIVLLGRAIPDGKGGPRQDCVCLWPPPDSSPSSSTCAPKWGIKPAIFPKEVAKRGFTANELFVLNGMAMWADLQHGILVCRLGDLLESDRHNVQLIFVDLPPGCCNDGVGTRPIFESSPVEEYRSIACVSGTIKFVSIEGYLRKTNVDLQDRKVTMWSLTPESWVWSKECDLRVGDIWEQAYSSLPLEHKSSDGTATPMPWVLEFDWQQQEHDKWRKCRQRHSFC